VVSEVESQPENLTKQMKRKIPGKRSRVFAPVSLGACVGTALLSTASTAYGQAESGNTVRMERLEKENQELKQRLEALEGLAKKEGIMGTPGPTNYVKALSSIQLSGFVTASYFYDTSKPADRKSNGYLWNTSEDSFSLNKVKVTLASAPVERSGDKWDAGYRASLIFGEDAALVNTGGETQGLEDLREAYVELNAPLGSGLNIKAGQLISLLNYESGDGGAANPNFSQGYQWYYTGNGPSAGVQLGYEFTDWLDVKARVQNGLYAGAIDNNSAKTFMGSIGIKPFKDLWFSLIGFGGDENANFSVTGGSLLAGYQVTQPFGIGLEFDYFHFDPSPSPSADLWSIGTWLTYDFTSKVGLALRAEYLDDKDGFGIKGVALGGRSGSAIMSPDANGSVESVALTLNYKPFPNVKIQPEIRYDHTSYAGGYDGADDRFLIGAGISYLF
jgi:hypothetical protein